LRQRPNMLVTFFQRLGQTYQMMLDKWTPYTTSRWAFTVFLVLAFTARILIAQVLLGTFILHDQRLC
jgi:hypothetical protein